MPRNMFASLLKQMCLFEEGLQDATRQNKTKKKRRKEKEESRRNTQSLKHHPVTAFMQVETVTLQRVEMPGFVW